MSPRRSRRRQSPVRLSLIVLLGVLGSCGGEPEARALERAPTRDRVEALVAILEANAHASEGSYQSAGEDAARALDADGESAALHDRGAWFAWRLGEYDQAVRHFRRSFALSGDGEALLSLAHGLAAAGDEREARAAYAERLASHDPTWWAPVIEPGEEQSVFERCVLHWSRAAKRQPDSALTHWLHGNALAGAERHGDARVAYERALELDADFAPATVSWAMTRHLQGAHAEAREPLAALLERSPEHHGAAWALAEIDWARGAWDAAADSLERCAALVGREAAPRLLVRGAVAAWRADREDQGIAFLNRFALVADSPPRARFDDDEALLERFVGRRPSGALERYAFASALFGTIATLWEQDNPMLLMAGSSQLLERVNRPLPEDDALLTDLRRRSAEAQANLDIGTGFMLTGYMGILPHVGRARRELEQALDERPDFAAARVLLAEIHFWLDEASAGSGQLEAVLSQHADATTVRLRLSHLQPLDLALASMEAIDPRDADQLRVLARRAELATEAGETNEAAAWALGAIARHGTYWDLVELVAFERHVEQDGERALALLDLSHPHGRSARGALLRASLRCDLGRGGATEALIDAWRASPQGSTEEAQAQTRLRAADASAFVCGGCGGSGTVQVTGGTTGEYGRIETVQDRCPQCLGLGLWHPGAL